MKITNQNIPPELAAAYAKLVVNKPANPQGVRIARTTKKSHLPISQPTKKTSSQEIESAVDELIKYQEKKQGKKMPKEFRADQIAKIKAGNFDPLYWKKCTIDSETILQNVPSSVPYTGGRPYAYPDPANQPTRATYGAGAVSAGTPHYEGMTVGGFFQDQLLRWKRTIFSLANSFKATEKEPVFLKINGTITASASTRAARALISVIYKRLFVPTGSYLLNTTDAPTVKPSTIYYRYITPRGGAPYWNWTEKIKGQYYARGKKYEDQAATMTKCVLLTAPMPMMGWRYNNNTSCRSDLSATCELWQIKKSAPGFYLQGAILHTDGSYDAKAMLGENWLIFTDQTHGIGEWTNPSTGALEYKLITGSLTTTAYSAPWESLPNWATGGGIISYNKTATGFLIAVFVQGDTQQHYYKVSADGSTHTYYNDTTAPNLWQIASGSGKDFAYLASLDQYVMNDIFFGGTPTLFYYDNMGKQVTSFDYGYTTSGAEKLSFASDSKMYLQTMTGGGLGYTAQIWQVDVNPAVLLGEGLITNQAFTGITYHASEIFIWSAVSTDSCYKITEAGATSAVANPGLGNQRYATPFSAPYIEG